MEQLLERLATSPEAYPAEALAPEALHALEAIARWAESGGGWWEPRWDGEQPMLQLVHITRLLAHVEPQRPDTDAILAHLVQQSVRCGMLLDAMMGTALPNDQAPVGKTHNCVLVMESADLRPAGEAMRADEANFLDSSSIKVVFTEGEVVMIDPDDPAGSAP